MPQPIDPKTSKRNLRIITFGVLAAGIVLSFQALRMTIERVNLLTSGTHIGGEVIRVEERPAYTYRGKKTTALFPVIRYKLAGSAEEVFIKSETATGRDGLKVGDHVDVVYPVDAPDKGMIIDKRILWAKNILLWIVGIMVTGMGIGLWFFFLRPERPRRVPDNRSHGIKPKTEP